MAKPIPRDLSDEQHPVIDPFLADVMTHMLGESQRVTNQVMDNYKAEIAELKATIALIRDGVLTAYDKPYIPQPQVVVACLYPTTERIKEEVKANEHAA
jgi:hypothetical protein